MTTKKGKKGKAKSTAVAKQKAAVPVKKAHLETMAAESGAGMETMTAEDFALPFVNLLQDLSPQTKRRDADYIDGAEPGMFFNSVTQELYDGEEGFRVVPVMFEKVYNEWVPRDSGGGFVATYDSREDAHRNCTEGNDIVDTANVYCLIQGAYGWTAGLISLKSTKLKIARRWNSLARMRQMESPDGTKFTPPYYAVIYRMKAVEESNPKGDFWNLKIEDTGTLTLEEDGGDLYEQAKELLAALRAGRVGADFSKDVDNDAADAEVVQDGDDPF